MSKLDDILNSTAKDIATGIVSGTWTEGNTKQQIKDLMVEIIDPTAFDDFGKYMELMQKISEL